MRIYLMAVGTRDPFWMERDKAIVYFTGILKEHGPNYLEKDLPLKEGPILTFFDRQPVKAEDHIVLIATKGEPPVVKRPTDRCGEETKSLLLRTKPHLKEENIHLEFLENIDPSELDRLYDPLRELVEKALQKRIPNRAEAEELIVNVSPGTPQIQASWYIMAHFGHLTKPFADRPPEVRLLQVKEAVGGTVEIVPVYLVPLAAEQQIELGLRFLGDYSFIAAARVFGNVAKLLEPYENLPEGKPHSRAAAARVARELCYAYHYWDLFHNDVARKKLEQLLGNEAGHFSSCPELKNLIEEQIRILWELEQAHRYPKLKAINAYHIAKLAEDRRDWVECVIFANISYEQVLIERVLRIAQARIGHRPDPFRWEESLREILRESSEKKQDVKSFREECKELFQTPSLPKYLGVRLIVKLLEAWDQEFKQDNFWKEAKERITDVRDMALHRMAPPDEGRAKGTLEAAEEALARTFGEGIKAEIEGFPFSKEAFRTIREHLHDLLA